MKLENKILKLEIEINELVEKQRSLESLNNDEFENEIYDCKYKLSKKRFKLKLLKDELEWSGQSKEVKDDFNTDLTFYKSNGLCYWLVLLAAVLDLVYLIQLLSVIEKNIWIGVSILFNIAVLLFLFTSAIKIKNYKKTFNIPVIVFGFYTVARVFGILPHLVGVNYSLIGNAKYFIIICSLLISVLCIISSLISMKLIKKQENFIRDGKIQMKHLSK